MQEDISLTSEDWLNVEREACARSLAFFIKRAWHVLEPSQPYVHGWHLDAICEHLEAVANGQITRLLINIPPGTMKSMASAVFFPAWQWGPNGRDHYRFIGASHEEGLATRDCMKMRRLVKSDWYRALWPIELTGDQNQKQYFETERTGWRQACPVGSMTGKRGDCVLWDDPHSVEDAHSPAKLESANRIFKETLPTRLNNPDKSAIIVLMQRLNQKDVAGEIIANAYGYDQLILPMEYEAPRKATSIGFVDPRTKPGDLLFPERFPRAVVERDKKIMGSYAVAGQFQQRPAPAGGGIVKVSDFRLWPADKAMPDFLFIVQSYDTAFTEKTQNDPTGCQVWGVFEHEGRRNVMLLDRWNERLGYPALKKKVMEDWHAKYGGVKNDPLHPSHKADVLLIENKGSGQSLIQDLNLSGVPAVPYNPGRADKIARVHVITPLIEDGVFWVLESGKEKGLARTWARPMLTALEQFPNGDHDEDADCLSQAATYLRDSGQLDMQRVPDDVIEELDYHKNKPKRNPYG